MSGVRTIFLKERSSALRTPRYWAVGGLFALISGFYFAVDLAMRTAVLSLEISFLNSLLFVFIPLLTMGSYAEEKQKGTDRLLLTAPVKASDIVLGKYLSSCLTFFTLTGTILPHLILILALDGKVDQITLTSYVAFLLTGFVYMAIGQLISSLVSDQTIAALVSMLVFLAFNLLQSVSGAIGVFVGRLVGWLDVFNWLKTGAQSGVGAAVTRAIDWLNPATKLGPISEGILSVSSFVYLLSLIVLFLFLIAMSLERRRWKQK